MNKHEEMLKTWYRRGIKDAFAAQFPKIWVGPKHMDRMWDKCIKLTPPEPPHLPPPICVGRPVIEILAREGQWLSESGVGVIAADCLFRKNPYDEIDRLKKKVEELTSELDEVSAWRVQLGVHLIKCTDKLQVVFDRTLFRQDK